jgi:tRNA 5-methylaminomethyl-2-thiouridine biosynthesis bifunctional protein
MAAPSPAWAHQPAWTVLDTAFQGAVHFLLAWKTWLNDPQRPQLLHYVAIADAAALPDWFDLADSFFHDPQLERLASQLAAQCTGVQEGFHRILLNANQVSLTLCVGALKSTLDELRLQADKVWIDVYNSAWDAWAVKSLTRSCKRGTRVGLSDFEDGIFSQLLSAGFKPLDTESGFEVVFEPDWDINTSRQVSHAYPHPAARCAIVGAGLSGASVAQALALRGWQVTVFDHNASPAEGASGLPAGLVAPYVTADDSPSARMSRIGARLMLQHAEQFLTQGQDWDGCGVQEHCFDGATRLKPLWHTHAGWIKPAKLIEAWLQQPGITFQGHAHVAQLRQHHGLWQLLDSDGQLLGQAEVVVLANAMGCKTLLPNPELQSTLAALQPVHGAMSYGLRADCAGNLSDWPHFPVNGHGSFIPAVPADTGLQWFAGATFSTGSTAPAPSSAQQHQFNLARLQTLLPTVGNDLLPLFENNAVKSWVGTRCVTADRLPLVGAVSPTLWMSIGMGARGLSFSALCAELLAAQLCGEPLPLPLRLARSLDLQRQRHKSDANPG